MPSDVIDLRHRADVAELTEQMDAALLPRRAPRLPPRPCPAQSLVPRLPPAVALARFHLRSSRDQPLHILDVGCGYGDALRRIERWARARGVAVELTGLDLNPDAVAIATEATPPASAIRWVAADIFSWQPDKPIHLVVSSLFTHHLAEPDLIRFLQWMELHAEFAWFINDLSRAAIPYHLLRIFSKLAGLHPFVQHDGPVSIARSFIPEDWQRMCAAAGLNPDAFSIQPSKPGRLCVSRIKTP